MRSSKTFSFSLFALCVCALIRHTAQSETAATAMEAFGANTWDSNARTHARTGSLLFDSTKARSWFSPRCVSIDVYFFMSCGRGSVLIWARWRRPAPSAGRRKHLSVPVERSHKIKTCFLYSDGLSLNAATGNQTHKKDIFSCANCFPVRMHIHTRLHMEAVSAPFSHG